jgi:hypothetical protein
MIKSSCYQAGAFCIPKLGFIAPKAQKLPPGGKLAKIFDF